MVTVHLLYNLETKHYLAGPSPSLVYTRKNALKFSTEQEALQHLRINNNFVKSLSARGLNGTQAKTWEIRKLHII
jgi:hypothetical protein